MAEREAWETTRRFFEANPSYPSASAHIRRIDRIIRTLPPEPDES